MNGPKAPAINMPENAPSPDVMNRVAKESQNPQLLEQLSQLSPSTLQSALMLASREKTKQKDPADLLREYNDKSAFFRPSTSDQVSLLKLQELQLSAITGFDIVQTAPIVPQGLNAVLTSVSQDVSLVTTRNSEVAGDPTMSLALEASLRRKYERDTTINLATSQHVLRMQPFDKGKGYMQHFLLLGLCTAGKSTERFDFLYDIFKKHIGAHLDMFAVMKANGYQIDDIEVLVSDISVIEQMITAANAKRDEITRNSLNPQFNLFEYLNIHLPETVATIDSVSDEELEAAGILDRRSLLKKMEEEILHPLKEKYPNVTFGFELSRKAGLGYYDKGCFHIFGTNAKGEKIQLSDGGRVNWTAKLLNDRKELCVISGMGSELIHKLFKQT